MLRGAQATWQFSLTQHGMGALNLLAQEDFDAVIADQTLTDIPARELLDLVMQRHPRALRFLYTPLDSDAARLKLVGVSHQLLNKPCSPQTLQSALRRGFSFRTWLPGGAVARLVPCLNKLPSPPDIYFQVIKEIQSPYSSAASIGALVAKDPAVAAKLLQIANSVAFGLHHPISDVRESVMYLGIETTRSIILLAHTFSYFDRFKVSFRPEDLWNHSVRVAQRAQKIARMEAAPQEMLDQCYTAGLLHDLGKMVLAANLPELYAQCVSAARMRQTPIHLVETELFGATHAEVGAALFGVWGLADGVLEAVALHHNPARLLNTSFCPLTAVHAANFFCEEVDVGPIPGSPLDSQYIETLGLSLRVEKWRQECRNAVV
jgi:putative nucleotidyltransferase with HDIG domain